MEGIEGLHDFDNCNVVYAAWTFAQMAALGIVDCGV